MRREALTCSPSPYSDSKLDSTRRMRTGADGRYMRRDPGDGRGYGTLPFAGHAMCFWDGRADPDKNLQRLARVRQLFKTKYPEISPADLPAPACGW